MLMRQQGEIIKQRELLREALVYVEEEARVCRGQMEKYRDYPERRRRWELRAQEHEAFARKVKKAVKLPVSMEVCGDSGDNDE